MIIFLQLAPLLIFNSLYIFGFFNAGTYKLKSDIIQIPAKISKDMIDPESREILTYFRIMIENKVGDYYSKPIITCPMCMASLHSILPYFIWNCLAPNSSGGLLISLPPISIIAFYPFYICALAAYNKAMKKYFVDE